MSSCLSGGGGGGAAAYRLESLDLELIKSPSSTTSWISTLSSPSSESSPLTISTRKPRTPRKRPNQTYNEAAALLATAYPKIFPAANGGLVKPSFSFESSELLVPFRPVEASFLPRRPGTKNSTGKACRSPPELDFDAESIILDGEVMGEGIDCIMGDFDFREDCVPELKGDFCYGYPVGLGFENGEIGMRKEVRAIRGGEERDWWRFPAVDSAAERKQKAVEKTEEVEFPFPVPRSNPLLKLNHDAVLEAWSGKASPFSDDVAVAGSDVQARLAQIDLFGGMREASVMRYKEKRRNRLFSKKIRYEVRKVNADRRPRMKGRFVRTQNSNSSGE